MSKQNRRRQGGQQAAPTRQQQGEAEARRNKKEFVKGMMKAERLVVFSGNQRMSHWGFPGNGDMLLFLLQEVYAWDGTNEHFQNILAQVTGQNRQPTPEDADLNALMDEAEGEVAQEIPTPEGAAVGQEDNGDDLFEDGGAENDDGGNGVPLEEASVEQIEPDELAALEARLAALKAKKAAQQAKPKLQPVKPL